MATLSNLTVNITGSTVGLNKSLTKAQSRMDKFRNRASLGLRAVQTAAKGLAVAGAASLVAFGVGAVKSFADAGDEIQKMAQRTGFTTEALSELKFAAEQSGSSLATIEKGSKRLSTTILDAQMGLSTATDAFLALGISVSELQGLSPEEQFQKVANALAAVDDASTRAALAQRVFGRAGTELLPLFQQGEAGMMALREQAQQLGVVWSQDAANSAADFKDAQNELKTAFAGVAFTVAKEIVPAITDFARNLIQYKPQVIAFFEGVRKVADVLWQNFKSGLDVIWPIFRGLVQFIVRNKPILIAAIVAIGIAIVSALGPVSLAVLAILGIITAIGFVRDNWDEIWGVILRIWENVSGRIVRLYESNLGWLLPGGVLLRAINFFRDNWNSIWSGIRNGFEAFISPIRNSIEALTNIIGGVTGALGSIPGAGVVGNLLGNLPGFQGGVSNFSGGLARVHEGEVITYLPRGSSVTPAGAGGMGTVNIIIQGDVNGVDDFDRKVNEAVERFRRQGG